MFRLHLNVGSYIVLTVCSKKDDSLPYLCLDATYIAVLLKEGYGFTEDRKLTVSVQNSFTNIYKEFAPLAELICTGFVS